MFTTTLLKQALKNPRWDNEWKLEVPWLAISEQFPPHQGNLNLGLILPLCAQCSIAYKTPERIITISLEWNSFFVQGNLNVSSSYFSSSKILNEPMLFTTNSHNMANIWFITFLFYFYSSITVFLVTQVWNSSGLLCSCLAPMFTNHKCYQFYLYIHSYNRHFSHFWS